MISPFPFLLKSVPTFSSSELAERSERNKKYNITQYKQTKNVNTYLMLILKYIPYFLPFLSLSQDKWILMLVKEPLLYKLFYSWRPIKKGVQTIDQQKNDAIGANHLETSRNFQNIVETLTSQAS